MEHRTISGELREEEPISLIDFIRRRIKEGRIKHEAFRDKYWKLSSQERMEYDWKLRRIEEKHTHPLATLYGLKMILYASYFMLLLYFVGGKNIIFLNVAINIITILCYATIVVVVFDSFTFIFDDINQRKEIRELNKRFKLYDKRNVSSRRRDSQRNSKRK